MFFFIVARDEIGPIFLKEKPDPIFFEYISDFYLIIPFTFIFRMLFVIETSSLNALQKPLITGGLTFVQLIVLYYPISILLSEDYGYLGIFYAFLIATVLCGIASVVINRLILKLTRKSSLS